MDTTISFSSCVETALERLNSPTAHGATSTLVHTASRSPMKMQIHTFSLGPNAVTLSTISGSSNFANISDMYAVSTSGIIKRSTTGLVSFQEPPLNDAALSSSRIVLVRDQIASLHLGIVASTSPAVDDFNSATFPRLNSRTNSSRDSARIGGGSSSGYPNSDEERGGGGT